jgi:hypothetical protein
MPEPSFPFVVERVDDPDARIDALFAKCFGAAAPREPLHFTAVRAGSPRRVAGYVHFLPYKPGIFLCGGLCVDSAIYRTLTPPERERVAQRGSLSRWLSEQSIALLESKQAVFAYTGDARSRRDAAALGFEPARAPHLFVQWHQAPAADRGGMVEDVARLGPF